MAKMIAARQATAAAIDATRDGVDFAVIAGTNQALPAFPPNGRLATASAATRADAKRALGALQPNGGTPTEIASSSAPGRRWQSSATRARLALNQANRRTRPARAA